MDKTFTLRQIASWGINNTDVELPGLQRGLVWSPKQVELLWDSILRNFPIGGFVLSENNDGKYYLMDGQQRFNSIQTGFIEPDNNSESVLWIDIKYKKTNNSTRTYLIKATTKIHPWGFNNDDVSSVLKTNEKRDALTEFNMDGKNIFKDKITLMETYPVKAELPIPLAYLLNAPLDSDSTFSNYILKKLEKLSPVWKKKIEWENKQIEIKQDLEKQYYPIIKKLLIDDSYTVPFSLLPSAAIENETQTLTEQTNLEVLFTRLNTGGTPISRGDLQYSAIKAYWGDEFKTKIDMLAKDRMSPQTLALLLIRLALTMRSPNSEKFVNTPTIRQIRDFAKEPETKKYIEDFIFKNSDSIIKKVDNALSELPQYLIMKIIYERADLYLLFMYLIFENIDIQKYKIINLLLLLYWFSKDANCCNACINTIYKTINEQKIGQDFESDFSSLRKVVLNLLREEKTKYVFSPTELKQYFKPETLEYPKIETQIEIFWQEISDFRRTDTMLIFAEKEFLIEHYPNYIPASIKDWDKTNRPWDYDHIIPQVWSAYRSKGEPYKAIVDYWLWRTGNFAAIPFEINRSKNAYSEYSFYEEKAEQLLFSKEVENVTIDLIRNKDQAIIFAKETFERTIRVYEKAFDFIKVWFI